MEMNASICSSVAEGRQSDNERLRAGKISPLDGSSEGTRTRLPPKSRHANKGRKWPNYVKVHAQSMPSYGFIIAPNIKLYTLKCPWRVLAGHVVFM